MIIKQISLKNFQCYSGEHDVNTFKFNEGLNLIIGNNGGGKSKLFDAFYWVLYDQVFNSDTRNFISTREYGEKIISDKITRSCEVSSTCSTEVMLTAVGVNEKEYRLTRILYATKMKEDVDGWICEPSKLIIEEKKTTRWSPCSESVDSVLKRVIPPQLKPYMWFQGEQVDGLMDLTDKSALTQIINILSDINKYDEIINLVDKGSSKASLELRKSQNKLSKNSARSEQLSNEYEKIVKTIEKSKNDISLLEDNLEISNAKVEELISKIDDATKKSALKARKKELEVHCEKYESELFIKYSSLNSKIFKDYWVLKNSSKHMSVFSEKYRSYSNKHQSLINEVTANSIKLPINVPGPVHVIQMLEECHCYVCDREAPKGSEPWEFIKRLAERKNEPVKNIFKQDFSQYFQRLYESSLRFEIPIRQTNERIAAEFSGLESIRIKIKDCKFDIEAINTDFETLLSDDKSEKIVSEFRLAEKNKEIYSTKLASAKLDLNKYFQELLNIKKELESLVTGDIELAVINAEKTFNALFEIARSTRKDVYSSLVVDLEDNANAIFKSMSRRNNSITGRIRLKMLPNDTCIPEIIDNDGYIMSGSNDSNIILVKLSLIIAILTSKAKWSENYSLITDAPTAKMAKGYTEGFYEAIGANFKQAIIMTYDFVDANERELLRKNKTFKVGSIHIIEPDFPNGNRDDRSDLRVLVREEVQ
jgi:DNA sulfur modification protein DndD